jgi:hypothetical protein
VKRLLALALMLGALPLRAQGPGAAYRLDTVAVRADGGAGGVNYSTMPAPSSATAGCVGLFLGSPLSLGCDAGLQYDPTLDTLSVLGAVSARNLVATSLPSPGGITVTPTLSQLGGITVVAGAALADGDALSVGDGVGVVPIEFDASPGDGTTGGAVAIVFDGTETDTQIRDAVKAILDGAGRDWTTSAQAANGIGLVRATPGATGGAITEDVTDVGFSVTDWTNPTAATTYTYSLQACAAGGACTAAGAASSTAAGVLTLSVYNPNRLSWSAVTGAASYKIRRDVGGATQGVIWSGTALTVDDTGLAGDGTTAPTVDGTGMVTADRFATTAGATAGLRTATLVVAASNATAAEKAGADYVCDGTADEVQIQAAIDALPATGGSVVLSDGTFNTSTQIYSQFGLTLRGQGKGTIIKATAGFTGGGDGMISLYNRTSLRGNTSGNDVTIADLTLDGNALVVTHLYLRGYDAYVKNTHVRGVWFKNSTGSVYEILTDRAEDLQVSDCLFETAGDSNVEARRMRRALFVNNVFKGKTFQTYVRDATNGDITVTGNVFLDTNITFTPDSNGTTVARGFVFTGNSFVSVTNNAYTMALREVSGVIISGNVFNTSRLTTDVDTGGIISFDPTGNAARDVNISGNTFILGTSSSGTVSGPVMVIPVGDNVTIADNVISSPGTTTSMGISITGAATGVVIRNNRIKGAGAGASRVGISVAGATGVHVEGNQLETLETGLNIVAGATSTRVVGPLWTSSVTVPVADAGTTTSYHMAGLTAGRVPIVTAGGLVIDDAGLLYDPATDALTAGRVITGAGTAATPSVTVGSGGWYEQAVGTMAFAYGGAIYGVMNTTGMGVRSAGKYGFSSTSSAAGTIDLAIARDAAGRGKVTDGGAGYGAWVASQYWLSALNTAPANATEACTAGEMRWTADYHYFCAATNTWVRAALVTWP